MNPKVKVGEKIRVVFYNVSVLSTDKTTVQDNDVGVVIRKNHVKNLYNNGKGYHQIWVKWDKDGTESSLIAEQDVYEVLKT